MTAPVTAEMKRNVTEWVRWTRENLGHSSLVNDIDVQWNSRFTAKLGDARFKPTGSRVRFSTPIWPRASEEERRQTVIHEICHIIVAYEAHVNGLPRRRSHGHEWQLMMVRCKVPPERTHCVDTKGLSTRRRVEISCGCKEILVTKYIAGRIAFGADFRCKRCNGRMKAPEGTVPVERRKKRRRKRRAA